jgi:hypothetical protein
MTVPAAGVAVPAGAGHVLVGPLGAAHLARALALVEREYRLAGIRPSEHWLALRDAIDQAAAFAYETAKVRIRTDLSRSDRVITSVRVGTERVAELAGCSQQWARALLRRGEFATAQCQGSVWAVDEAEVVTWAVAKATHDEAAA